MLDREGNSWGKDEPEMVRKEDLLMIIGDQ